MAVTVSRWCPAILLAPRLPFPRNVTIQYEEVMGVLPSEITGTLTETRRRCTEPRSFTRVLHGVRMHYVFASLRLHYGLDYQSQIDSPYTG